MTGRPLTIPLWAALAALLAIGSQPAQADPISASSTGNVATDFPSGAPGVTTLVNPQFTMNDPASYIAANNMSPGWSIKDIRLYYDKGTDTMDVGVNFFGIAGDADGNGNPGTISPANASKGYLDMPSLGGRESITVGFDFLHTGTPQVLAGVPGEKSQSGAGLDGFNIALNTDNGLGLANSYGATLSSNLGNLAFDPSASHPGFEFTIKNFSKLPGYNPNASYSLVAFAGSPDDGVEEEGVRFAAVSAEHIQVPEPASWLAWSIGLAGASVLGRRRRRRQTSSN